MDHRMVGTSAALENIRSAVVRMAPFPIPVIVWGETGAGKEVVARALHSASERKGRCVIVNCAACPEGIVESRLFGHEAGSFTGAGTRQQGVFECAADGTLVLDGADDMPPHVQAKLLHAIESGRFWRLGGRTELCVTVRIVAVVRRHPEALIESGAWREDLYYRLAGALIEVPPLREHRDDVRPLARHFAKRLPERAIAERSVSPEAVEVLEWHRWPGNVRELEHTIQRAAIQTDAPVIGPEDVQRVVDVRPEPRSELRSVRRDAALEYFRSLIAQHRGNVREIARSAKMSLRAAYRQLKRLDLWEEVLRNR